MHPSQPEEFLAVDVGAAWVGVARGSGLARIAQPLKTLKADVAINDLKSLADELKARAIVVGLPRSLDGNDTEQTRYVRAWVEQARAKLNLPFYWQDEALTSKLVEGQEGGEQSHELAAAIILQDFLDSDIADRISV